MVIATGPSRSAVVGMKNSIPEPANRADEFPVLLFSSQCKVSLINGYVQRFSQAFNISEISAK